MADAAPLSAETRRPRKAGFVSLGTAMTVFLLVAITALAAQPAPPPTIAEFAPQAVEQVKEAPSNQGTGTGTGGVGEGDGGDAGGGEGGGGGPEVATPPPTVAPTVGPVIDVRKVRRCVGNPPRQIEDPQSPPCVAYWGGEDNGGATSKGVTADEIRIAVGRPNGEMTDSLRLLQDFFNTRFEFYGRRLKLVPFLASGARTIPEMKADALRIDTEIKPFATFSYNQDAQEGRQVTFYDELARRKIIGVLGDYTGPTLADQAHLERFAPYQWSYLPSPDQILDNYGEFYCQSLAGQPPVHAGGELRTKPARTLGILHKVFDDGTVPNDLSAFLRKLASCGVEPLVRTFRGLYPDAQSAAAYTPAMLDFKDNGVTSIMCVCVGSHVAFGFMPAATQQNYFPEWLISNITTGDDYSGRFYPAEHSERMFGIQAWTKQLAVEDWPIRWAVKEMDPSKEADMGGFGLFEYWNLLLVASGIQMAGPNLTPETFQEGLFRTRFPNPGAGAAPYYQGRVGFDEIQRSMIQDFSIIHWSNTTPSAFQQGVGTYCYIRGGARYKVGTWPAGPQPFFQPPCR